jgi:predicted nucleic acid-binding protein
MRMNAPNAIAERMHRALFSDTSCLYALADDNDPDHALVVAIAEEAIRQRRPFVVTTYVIAETHALLLRRLGRHAAAKWLRYAFDAFVIIRPTETDEERALDIIFRYTDKDFSFTDAISFAVMEQLGIKGAFALDEHFAQYGSFLVLPLQGATLPENG